MSPPTNVCPCDIVAAERSVSALRTEGYDRHRELLAEGFADFRMLIVDKIRHEAARLGTAKKYGASGALKSVATMIESGKIDGGSS